MIRTITSLGLYSGPPSDGNYHMYRGAVVI